MTGAPSLAVDGPSLAPPSVQVPKSGRGGARRGTNGNEWTASQLLYVARLCDQHNIFGAARSEKKVGWEKIAVDA